MSVVTNLSRKFIGKDGGVDFSLSIPEWHISDQGITALCGPSGSGKTTVFRSLIGLDFCSNMKWDFKGEDLNQLPIARRKLGVVFQDLQLFPHLTGRENIIFGGEARKVSRAQIKNFMDQWSDPLGFEQFIDRPVAVLSGGEKQRVGLARALIGEPRILMLDEPFSALDESMRIESRRLVKSIVDAANIPCLIISHDQSDIRGVASTVIQIKGGTLVG